MAQCPFGHEEGSQAGCAFCGSAAPVATHGLPAPHYATAHGIKAFLTRVEQAMGTLRELFPRGFIFLGDYPLPGEPKRTSYCARWYGDPMIGLARAHRLASMIDHKMAEEDTTPEAEDSPE